MKQDRSIKFVEKKCPVCNKTFIRRTKEWAYKINHNQRIRYFCSWTCLQTFRKENKIQYHKSKFK